MNDKPAEGRRAAWRGQEGVSERGLNRIAGRQAGSCFTRRASNSCKASRAMRPSREPLRARCDCSRPPPLFGGSLSSVRIPSSPVRGRSPIEPSGAFPEEIHASLVDSHDAPPCLWLIETSPSAPGCARAFAAAAHRVVVPAGLRRGAERGPGLRCQRHRDPQGLHRRGQRPTGHGYTINFKNTITLNGQHRRAFHRAMRHDQRERIQPEWRRAVPRLFRRARATPSSSVIWK